MITHKKKKCRNLAFSIVVVVVKLYFSNLYHHHHLFRHPSPSLLLLLLLHCATKCCKVVFLNQFDLKVVDRAKFIHMTSCYI